MLKLSVPQATNTILRIPLDGVTYDIHFLFNKVTQRHYINIFQGGFLLAAGLKLIDGALIFDKYAISSFNGGQLMVIKAQETTEVVSRDNLGINKPYELVYFSSEELG